MNRIDPPTPGGGATPLPGLKLIGWAEAKRREIKAIDAPPFVKLWMAQSVREAERMIEDAGIRAQVIDRGAANVPTPPPPN